MKMMIHNTNVRLPSAPTVLPMMEISRFNVGHDFASLNTLNWKQNDYLIFFYSNLLNESKKKNIIDSLLFLLSTLYKIYYLSFSLSI